MRTPTAEQISQHFHSRRLDAASRYYLATHLLRYQFLFAYIDDLVRRIDVDALRILDVGEAYQTEMLRVVYPDYTINALGFGDPRFPPRPHEQQYVFNLNDTQHRGRWIKTDMHHLVVMAEILEHLYTSPLIVLRFVASCLTDRGYLIVQTPNACSLARRLSMLFGKNPSEHIREDFKNPGHFREYTLQELMEIGNSVGFRCVDYKIENYFRNPNKKFDVLRSMSNYLPANFREGITICFQKDSSFLKANLVFEDITGIERKGFHNVEEIDGQLLRWTNGEATLRFPFEDRVPGMLTVDLKETMQMDFRLSINGLELERCKLPPGEWSKRYDLTALQLQAGIELKITTSTFVPARLYARSSDNRVLGVLFGRIVFS